MAQPGKRGAWSGKWDGGRVWRGADGKRTYWIERQVEGQRYAIRTGASTARAAYDHLARFEADPQGYAAPLLPLHLDNAIVEEFLRWSLRTKGNTEKWVKKQRDTMGWWLEKIPGVNLRRASLRDHILPALEGAPSRAAKIRVFKAFYSWLRKERHLVSAAEDPTYGTLSAPQSRPAQWKKSKVIPREHYLLAKEHLTGPWPDLLTVLAGTAWHVTELQRFAQDGRIEPLPAATRVESGAVGVLVCPRHKSGDAHRTAVSAEVLEAAVRVRERGAFSESSFGKSITAACRAAGIPVFCPSYFRHSVATWAVERGADPAAVSAFLGHKSTSTVKRFYSTLATVPKVPTLA